ncbi:MAG TPA: cytochrome c biogenesis protein ResB [Thermomicrobiales bacterium]|nr:cytochrome c biogenesis protein ResB [Thermomicrobiales bacterium]
MADISLQTRPSRPMAEVVIDRIWRFLCSVRAAIAEIAILSLFVLIGTLRGSEVPQWIADFLPFTQPVVDKWYAWDVYRSVPFAVILAVLAIAIAVCTINRVPTIWQTISHPKLTTSRGWLRNADLSATYGATGDVQSLSDEISDILKQRRYRVLTQKVGEDIHLYADKNRYAKLGTFPFHLALILLLVGGIVGAQYGFRNQEFTVTEGQTREVGHHTGLSIRLDRFQDLYVPMGVASQYESTIAILKNGKEVKSGAVSVNHPMTYQSATIYQSAFGNSIVLKITDPSGRVIYSDALPMGSFNLKGNPDAPAGLIDLPAIGKQLVIAGPDVAPFNQPELDKLKLQSGELWIEMSDRDPALAASTKTDQVITLGKPATIDGYTVTFERERRYSTFQVAYNPGIPIFIIAAVMLLGGLAAIFYFPQRRLRGIVSPAQTGSSLQIAPLAKRDWSAKRDFLHVMEKASEKLGEPEEIKLPSKGSEWQHFTGSSTMAP